LAVLLGVLGTFFIKAFASVRRNRGRREAVLLYMTALGLASVCMTGVFTFIFESPFVSSMVWILVAAGFRMMALLNPPREMPA
jgi:hypothetical protein